MTFALLWNGWKLVRKRTRRGGKRAARQSQFRPVVEALEGRVLLATQLWSGASSFNSNWSTAANWVGNVVPSVGDDLVFPGGASRPSSTNDFAVNTSFNSITIAGSGFTLAGNSVTLMSGLTDISANPQSSGGVNTVSLAIKLGASQSITNTYAGATLNANAIDTNGFTLTFAGSGLINDIAVISGSGAVVKDGPGLLLLQGASTYAGLTTINAGAVQLSANGTLGTTAAGTIVADGASLQLLNGISTTEPLTLNGNGLGGGLVTTTTGALQITGGSSTATGPITLGSDAVIGVDSIRT